MIDYDWKRRCEMKKFKLIMILIITALILASCSAMEEEPYMEEPNIYGYMFFNYDTMTFETNHEADILYNTGYAKDDYIILHQHMDQITLTSDTIDIYHTLFDKLILLSEEINEPLGRLLSYSSTAIKTSFEDYQIEVTLSDIVTFNEIKQSLDRYKVESSRPRITKMDYLSFILDITLIPDDLEDLDFLQKEYLYLYETSHSNNIKEMSFDDLISALQTIGKTYNETQISSLKRAYDTLTIIYAWDSEV